ncbi:WD40/YVTN/BNR-like repeat-containing protein [uncultured Fibrella sp.]|uniref:WD40/YVTN/BNR-like repeat-containing protein n=1 Tax=uncultured Fibrella sp. TaxID=1284596 RepID=UPI0035CA2138
MKGPFDAVLESTETASVVARPTTPRPEGGKVLQRLLAFAEERDLPLLIPELTIVDKPRRRKRADSERESAVEGFAGSGYAEALIDAAEALNAQQPVDTREFTEEADFLVGAPASPPTGVGPQWRFVGPTHMTNGQTYGESRVAVAGRVSAIAIDPSNTNHLLCGSAGGGLWESFTRGASWVARTDYAPTLTIGAIAFTPGAPATVYCGTGEGNFYAWLGAGLMRSTNGGATWTMHATTPFVGQGFYDLVVDPANASHLLAATTNGLYESADAGLTWTVRRADRCWDLSVQPGGGPSAEVLAACSGGLFRSTNGGTTWAAVALPSAPAGFSRLAVAIAPSNPGVAYAFGANGATGYLWRRATAGDTWAAITQPPGLSTGQAWYDWFLAVAPDNPNQIYLGAIEAYSGTLSGSTWTWITISNKTGDDIHPDQHAIAIDPVNPNVIYVGNDGGLFMSLNRGTSWTSLNPGLGIAEIEYMAQDHGSARWLLAGTQDNGTIRYTGSNVWEHVADGDGGDCAVNRVSPDVVFQSYFNMGMARSTVKGNWGSFSWIGPNVPQGYSTLFYPPMEACNDTIAQAGQSVFISRNRGTNWTEIALPAGLLASAMSMPTDGRLLVGTTSGRLFVLTWSGTSWTTTELTSPRTGANLSDAYVDPANANRIWVTYTARTGGRVFRSSDGGTTWTDCSAGLPQLPVNAIEVQPGNANRVWVAADVGVYQSLNAGATWQPFANGLPNSLAVDLLYHPNARLLRVGLRNRGVWEIQVDGPLANPVCGVQFTGSLTANQTRKWFTFRWPATWHVIWTVMPTNPLPGNPQVKWNVEVERADAEYATYWISVTNLTASPITFEGRYAILSYY